MFLVGLTLENHVVNAGFHCMAELSLEHFLDHSLICCPGIFDAEGHDFIAKDPPGCNEGCLLLAGLVTTRIFRH